MKTDIRKLKNKYFIFFLLLYFLSNLYLLITSSYNVLTISLFSASVMIIGIIIDKKIPISKLPLRKSSIILTIQYGIVSGIMVATTLLILMPDAIVANKKIGSIGVAFGILLGLILHTAGHLLHHKIESGIKSVIEVTLHALAGGIAIGLVFGTNSNFPLLFAIAIFSHKFPAGIALSRKISSYDKSRIIVLIPALSVGITLSLPLLFPTITNQIPTPLISGIAAGIFLHAALDFVPECDHGGEIEEYAKRTYGNSCGGELMDTLKIYSVISTVFGFIIILTLYLTFYT